MSVAKAKNLEEMVRNVLSEQNFDVKENLSIEDSFDIDMIARRGGLTLIVEFVQDHTLNFDSVAKLKTLSLILQERYKPISLKRILFTTSGDVSKGISDFAKNNSILIVKVEQEEEKIRETIRKINFLRPMFREEVNVLKILEDELKEIGDKSCLELLNRVEDWYQKGGGNLVKRQMRKEIDEIAGGV